MLSALIAVITALFLFISGVASDSALQPLQDAQNKVAAALSQVEGNQNNSSGENGEPENNYDNGEGNGGGNEVNGNPNINSEKPETTKVETYNLAAGFVLPTTVPQVAVDNSSNLVSCNDLEADCEDDSPGKIGAGSENSANGSVGLAKAEEAKSNRP